MVLLMLVCVLDGVVNVRVVVNVSVSLEGMLVVNEVCDVLWRFARGVGARAAERNNMK